ncbi:MAG: hypothetical protein ACFCUE_14470 [Candidatus Bathyarchaeia archaeon]|jgi:hypothetical protein
MSVEYKSKFIIALRGYKITKSDRNVNYTDISAVDPLNKKVLLRTMNPLANRYTDLNDIENLSKQVKLESFDSAILLSNNFTQNATKEMIKQNIQWVSESYMPPFAIEELYHAVINCIGKQCNKKCGKLPEAIAECNEIKDADLCKIRGIAANAKAHLESGALGLLKNDLKMALALGQ